MDCKDVNINIVFLDFPNVCRICLNKGEILKPFGQISLMDVFKNITNIEIELEDNLPKNICNRCINKLEDIATFIDLCRTNDTNLKEIVKKKEIEICLEDTCSNSEFDEADDSIDHSDDIDGNLESEKNHTAGLKDVTAEAVTVPASVETEDKKPPGHSTKRQPSSCEVCGENFNTKRKLTEHQKQNDNCKIKQYKCTNCEKSFFTKFRLKLHTRSHTKETPYECKLCGKKFRFAPNLKRHDDIVHKGLKPYKCDICGKEFARHTSLVEHERDHSGEIPFVCNYCGLSFKKTGPYHYHLNLHRAANSENNSDDFTCNICGKIFGSKTTLKKHGITHTKENAFLCDICGKNFSTKQILGNHIRVHLGVKPFKCGFCEKSFSRKSTLRVHTLYHTKEKPFKCKTCLKTFAQLVHLRNHERIHNGEKPYKCSYCNRTFSVKCNLVIHTRIHTNDTTYKCTVCEKMCYESRSLKKHMKVHQDSSLIVLTNEDITTLLS